MSAETDLIRVLDWHELQRLWSEETGDEKDAALHQEFTEILRGALTTLMETT